MESGLRGGGACNLPFNPVLTDSNGWPCLRFEAIKVRAERLIPLSAKTAAAIGAQQDSVRQQWPAGSPWLFPGMAGNHDGQKPYPHRTFIQQLEAWPRTIDLCHKTGHLTCAAFTTAAQACRNYAASWRTWPMDWAVFSVNSVRSRGVRPATLSWPPWAQR